MIKIHKRKKTNNKQDLEFKALDCKPVKIPGLRIPDPKIPRIDREEKERGHFIRSKKTAK